MKKEKKHLYYCKRSRRFAGDGVSGHDEKCPGKRGKNEKNVEEIIQKV